MERYIYFIIPTINGEVDGMPKVISSMYILKFFSIYNFIKREFCCYVYDTIDKTLFELD